MEDHNRCKIKFRTTFVFYSKLIFSILIELESVKNRLNIFFQIFSEIFKAFWLKKEWKNQLGVENKSCPKFDFTSPMVLQIFFRGQIFLILRFEIFKLKYFQKGSSKNFNSGDILLCINFSPESHWQKCRTIFCLMMVLQGYCGLFWICKMF